MKKKIAIIAAIFVIGGFSVAYALRSRGNDGLVAAGTLEARNISVGSKVGGRINRVLVREGDQVEPNQLIVVFDSGELEGQLLQARGRLEAARANLAKMLRALVPRKLPKPTLPRMGTVKRNWRRLARTWNGPMSIRRMQPVNSSEPKR